MNSLWKFIVIMLYCFNGRDAYPTRRRRLSSIEQMPSYYYSNVNGVPGTYTFGYDVSDPSSGNTQFRTEERYPNGTVVGSYGYIDPFGRPQRFTYIADERGYRVTRDGPPKVHNDAPSPQEYGSNSVESSITWSRPKKKYNTQAPRRNYQAPYISVPVRPPSYYLPSDEQ